LDGTLTVTTDAEGNLSSSFDEDTAIVIVDYSADINEEIANSSFDSSLDASNDSS